MSAPNQVHNIAIAQHIMHLINKKTLLNKTYLDFAFDLFQANKFTVDFAESPEDLVQSQPELAEKLLSLKS